MNVTSLFHSKPVPILIQALIYKGRKISHKRPWPQWNPEIYKINYRYNSLLQCIEKHTICWYTYNIRRKWLRRLFNQLLFACRKYLLGLWKLCCSDYFSLRTSSQTDNQHLDHKNQSPLTFLFPIYFEIILSRIKVGFQQTINMYTVNQLSFSFWIKYVVKWL